VTTPYALFHLLPRGVLHIEPGMPVYEGMIIGEHNRPNDLDVNCTREKKLTNIRAAGRDENVTLPRRTCTPSTPPWSGSTKTSYSRSPPTPSAPASKSWIKTAATSRRPVSVGWADSAATDLAAAALGHGLLNPPMPLHGPNVCPKSDSVRASSSSREFIEQSLSDFGHAFRRRDPHRPRRRSQL